MNIEDELDELEIYLGFKPTRSVRCRASKVGLLTRLFRRKKKVDEWG